MIFSKSMATSRQMGPKTLMNALHEAYRMKSHCLTKNMLKETSCEAKGCSSSLVKTGHIQKIHVIFLHIIQSKTSSCLFGCFLCSKTHAYSCGQMHLVVAPRLCFIPLTKCKLYVICTAESACLNVDKLKTVEHTFKNGASSV